MGDEDVTAQRFAEVLKLAFVDGLGIRAIARRLHVARKTVRRVLDRERRKRVGAPTASRPTLLAAYDGAIRQMLSDTPELKAPAVLERLRPLGYRGGVTIVRDRLRQLRPHAEREPFLTLDFAPGAAVQVDWADFGFALPGCQRRVSAFVMALCYSRMLYIEFVLMGSRIYWIGGGKGGVGKSMVSMALVDYLAAQGAPLFLVDSDTSNPDVYKSYREEVRCELLDLDKVDGWIHLVNLCETHRDKIMVVNTAARSNSAVTKFGGALST